MNILIAPDKFKGSLTAQQVSEIIATGLDVRFNTTQMPMADGGNGTLEVLIHLTQGHLVHLEVRDPLFRTIKAAYGITGDGKTAIIEMARASGLNLLHANERNPLCTSSYGTGELIRHALGQGVDEIVLAIGGSATNDAGLGMAVALGYQIEDDAGQNLKPIGEQLIRLHQIRMHNIHPQIARTRFVVLCDVDNPLFGKAGAAWVFGPQKGADTIAIHTLDAGLQQVAKVVAATLGKHINFPGAGAAGGLGGGAFAFLNAVVEPGFEYIAQRAGIDQAIPAADVVITGEGCLDAQTLSDKVVAGVSRRCLTAGRKCIAVVGKNTLTEGEAALLGLSRTFALVDQGLSEEAAIENAQNALKQIMNDQVIPWLVHN